MAREKHLTSVHIGNFKRFRGLQVDNLGQFNLVVGDNNTGKTSFLEALLVSDNGAKWIGDLATCLAQRKNERYVEEALTYLEVNFQLFLNDNDEPKITLELNTLTQITNYRLEEFDVERDLPRLEGLEREKVLLMSNHKGFTFSKYDTIKVILDKDVVEDAIDDNSFIPFIPFGLGYDKHLITFFAKKIDNNISKRQKFIENLKLFIPKVQDVRLGQDTINIFEEGRDYPQPLFTYGEGSTKLFRILCEIAICEGKRLMIDEIDAGIHHTKFVQFWKILIQAAKAYDVQLFATTHNEECLKYFQLALESEELEEERALARVVSLKVRKENKVRARVYDFEGMQTADELGHEIRGGGL